MKNKWIYGNQCDSDNAFTKKARLLQSMYRVEMVEDEGVGPTRGSKRKFGNMISGGEVWKELPDEGDFRVCQGKSSPKKGK